MYKIVHILPSLGYGGAERCLVDLINNSSPDFRYLIICFFDITPLLSEIKIKKLANNYLNFEFLVLPKKGKISLKYIKEIENVLKEFKADLVHTHLGGDLWGRIAAKNLGLPVVTTEHNINNDDPAYVFWAKKLLKNKTDVYIAVSKKVKEYLLKEYQVKKPIEVVQCGVELEKFVNLPSPKFEKKLKLAIIGRLTKQKGHKFALEGLAKLKEYSWELEIVGSGELEQEIKNKIKELKLETRVKMRKATKEIPKVLADKDIVLMPSLWEGLGIVGMEVMSSGRVLVASACDGLLEIIENNKTGILVKPGNSEDIKEKLRMLFNSRDFCKEISQTAKQKAKINFGVEKMSKKYEEIYKSLL